MNLLTTPARCLACVTATLILLLAATAGAADAPRRPNVLILLADDLGFSDVGCFGSEIRTPHLDALASDGLRFTQFYSCSRCCPSRASLLTGLYPHEAGVGLMTIERPGNAAFPGYRGALNESCVTLGQVAKAAGYRTAAVGKWHVGDRQPPTARGFDDFYGYVSGYAVDSWEPRMMIRLPEGRPQRTYAPGQYFATDAITDHALDFLAGYRKEADRKPWLLYFAFQAGHFPIASRKDDMAGYVDLYAKGWDATRDARLKRQKELGVLPPDSALTPRSRIPVPAVAKRIGSMTPDGGNPAWDSLPADRRADLARRMAVYAGMVTGMDRNIGRIIDDLRAAHELDDTLVVFMSDNGACAEWEPFGFEMPAPANPHPGAGINMGTERLPNRLYAGDELAALGQPGSRASYGSGWANVSNTPFRLYKHYSHEGGIAGPTIVHWPAVISAGTAKPGSFVARPSHLIDVMATLVDVAGATYPKESDGHAVAPMEGFSLVAALRGQPEDPAAKSRPLFFEHEGNAAARVGDLKLVRVGRGGAWELYDLKADRTELHDLAKERPDKVKQLAEMWEAWAVRTHVKPYPGGGGGGGGGGAGKAAVDVD